MREKRLPRGARLACCCLALCCLITNAARAQEKPLWEAGAGAAVLDFPHYRGSNERRAWLLPFPYFVYRGDVLQVDERRMRSLFFRSERIELDLSANGTVPVKSSEDEARRGMPDLDATLEIGPSVNVLLARGPRRKARLELRLPVRTVIASDFSHFKHAGWVSQPNLNLDVRDALGNPGWNLGLQAGLLFSDRRYHQYFYSVEPEFATPSRPAFSASGGYAGTQFIAALSKRFPRYWMGGYAKWDDLHGAAFEDSPLVRSKQNFTFGFAIAWILGESETRVRSED